MKALLTRLYSPWVLPSLLLVACVLAA